AHLSDAIGIPWVHVFFSEKTLINTYKELVKNLPDGAERIDFRISKKE
ncbi:MAG TPA: class I SAM-dependent methyltransferase, partial [Clostridiales bacterium]|nr:class I SAM-dependent methyltransferase [Clostridiales bacterium]